MLYKCVLFSSERKAQICQICGYDQMKSKIQHVIRTDAFSSGPSQSAANCFQIWLLRLNTLCNITSDPAWWKISVSPCYFFFFFFCKMCVNTRACERSGAVWRSAQYQTRTQSHKHKHLQDSLLTVNILIFSDIAALRTIPWTTRLHIPLIHITIY